MGAALPNSEPAASPAAAPRDESLGGRWGFRIESASGPRVARLFHRLLAAILIGAWLSLGSQVQLLIGSRGLLPFAPLADEVVASGVSWLRFPSLLVFWPSDAALDAGIAVGVALAALAILGVLPRLFLALSAPLYLSYAVACRDFTSFQWDNLLVECCLLAALLPRRAPSPVAHGLMRLLLFKLYLESGIAKMQSHLGDWFDGSAMTFYYETAPLPAWPAWYAHHLPDTWHFLESWGAVGLETVGALLILGPRRARLAALLAFTGFQVLNLLTANYGFFVYLALALHVFLLDERDVEAGSRALRSLSTRLPRALTRLPRVPRIRGPGEPLRSRIARAGRVVVAIVAVAWIAASIAAAGVAFAGSDAVVRALRPIHDRVRSLRVANAYHLFGHITRERIEPELQTRVRVNGAWTAHDFHYKPGAPSRPPPFAAPHQPRVDFRLWFYGLSFSRGAPRYVDRLLERVCDDPDAVQALFPAPLPSSPEAVRIEFWRYHFTTPEERARTGDWWTRESLGALRPLGCRSRTEPTS